MSATTVERLALAEALRCLWLYAENPQPALPEGHSTAWRTWRDHRRVRGPWPAIEARILAGLQDAAAMGWEPGDISFWSTDTPGEMFVGHDSQSRAWARIRVTVEVLDGIPGGEG